ncbi:hypothetical protein LCGC14_0693800 [marine sediment metagenome]|uniref:Uncharacterized protein n=1 Tax=marine sediment metagenome TaxID=412755 RepID=A0A0F9QPN9_9ZZZZ
MSDNSPCKRCGKLMDEAEEWNHGHLACIEYLQQRVKRYKQTLEEFCGAGERAMAESIDAEDCTMNAKWVRDRAIISLMALAEEEEAR